MKPKTLTALILTCLVATASAEKFHLKDGTAVEGKILKEDAESYTLEVMVTKSIKDEKVLKKADVTKVEREKTDEKAFAALTGLVPAPDLLAPADYEARLKPVYEFIKGNTGSPLVAKARAIAGELEKELDAVQAGGMKLGGKIVSASDVQANKYELDARVIETSIRTNAAASRWPAALRKFEELEKNYQASASYKEILPFIKQIITRYRTETSELAASFDKRAKDRQQGLDRMSPDDRADSIRAIAEETDAAQKRYADEKKATIKWVTTHPDVKASLDETVRYCDSESKRLDSVKLDTLPDGGKAYRDAWSAIRVGGDQKDVTAALAAARTAKLGATYISELENAAQAAGLKK